MQNSGGEAAAAQGKRTRRPSVRLHQPYYENPGHRKLQQQWKAAKKELQVVKKPRTVKNVRSNGGVSDCGKGEEMEDFDFDDDVAIANWKKNFSVAKRGGDFIRKRVRSSSSRKWGSGNSRKNEDFSVCSGGESGEHEDREEEEEEEEEEHEENLGANGNLFMESLDPNSPNCSFGNDDGNDKLSDDYNNVGGKEGRKLRGLSNDRYSNEMGGKVGSVSVWLNELGLGKYAPLFEVHGVDDEVLPSLTLEDLKDMGINEVGPRRKMYSSIQKLSKGLL